MSQLKRIFRNRFFYLAVVLEIFSMLYPHMDTHYFWQTPLYYFSSADFLYFMLMPLRHGIGNLLLPFIAALPSAIFLAQNRRNKTDLLMNYVTLMLTAITWSLVAVSLACFTINLGVVVGGTFLLHYLSSWLLNQVLHISQWSPMVLQAPDIFYNQSIGFMMGRLLCWVIFSLCVAIFCLNRYFSHMKE